VTGTERTLLDIEFIYRGIVKFHEPGLVIVFATTLASSSGTLPHLAGPWRNCSNRGSRKSSLPARRCSISNCANRKLAADRERDASDRNGEYMAMHCKHEEHERESKSREGPADSKGRPIWRKDEGNSMIEVALFLPIFTLLICYAINFGYFFFVAATLTSSARNAVQYAIQGFSSPAQSGYASAGPIGAAGTVAALAVADIGLIGASTVTSVQVCSSVLGTTTARNRPVCATYGATSTAYAVNVDPEYTMFQTFRVDVTYTVTPPIPMSFLSVPLLSNFTFHRMVEMRAN
jgi:Flp pilus assembly protein TadG